MSGLAETGSAMRYRRMRAPQQHGEVLHLPPASEIDSLWRRNGSRQISNNRFAHSNLEQLKRRGRTELYNAAIEYSRQHRDVSFATGSLDVQQIVMAGHQPTLFHAGVWYKNFVLSALGSRYNCLAINLVVDNDICATTSLSLPWHEPDSVTLKSIAYDQRGPIVPFEERRILDDQIFCAFGHQVADGIRPLVNRPIVEKLWVKTVANRNEQNIGWAIARGRHALESEIGLHTLELPISNLTQTSAFASFAAEILLRLDEFIAIYNQVLADYRRTHRIRSRFQPVPELQRDGRWHESPFWIWQSNRPQRRSLFISQSAVSIELSNRLDFELTIPLADLAGMIEELQNSDIRIRPKALMTTLFSRTVLSDLFIHGIGGSKYDQLTDEIGRRFFGVELPEYLTITATMKLNPECPTDFRSRISDLESQLRGLEFQPERFLESGQPRATEIVARKWDWIDRELPRGQRQQRHAGIVECNRQLQPFVQRKKTEFEEMIKQLEEQLETCRILGSREFSFCLFDESLCADLDKLNRNWLT